MSDILDTVKCLGCRNIGIRNCTCKEDEQKRTKILYFFVSIVLIGTAVLFRWVWLLKQ